MKLLESITVARLLEANEPPYIAFTQNHHGIITATGRSAACAVEALTLKVRAFQTPPETFTEPFGPRSEAEWYAQQGTWRS